MWRDLSRPASRYLVLAVLLWCWAVAALAQGRNLDAIERAVGLLEIGEVEAARTVLIAAEGQGPPSPRLLAAEGIVCLRAGEAIPAEGMFRKALVRDPGHLAALWGLSLCLLQRGCAYEASTVLERAVTVAPADTRLRTLLAYTCLALGRAQDAAAAGKTALEGGERSPFLLAVLAEVHHQLGHTRKALEFGDLAARRFSGMDFLATEPRLLLPLTMAVVDAPPSIPAAEPPSTRPAAQRTDLEILAPRMDQQEARAETIRVTAPVAGSTIRGRTVVQAACGGAREIRFVAFLVDDSLRGLTTDLPYHFTWDAGADPPGEHRLRVRAYDARGALLGEDAVVVHVAGGGDGTGHTEAERAAGIEERAMAVTMPDPAPLSLFTRLGAWRRETGEKQQAIVALEKAAAINPAADGVLEALMELYRENGLHPIARSGQVYRGPSTGLKRVALTFDDGPNPLYTPSLLAALQPYHARATFFLVGKMVQQFPDLAQQILADGHELANHSYTHMNLTRLERQEIIAEALRTRAAIKETTGQQTYLFRPPGGNIDSVVTSQLRALDYNIVYWDINAGEFAKLPPDAQVKHILARVTDGSIILLHNGPVDGTLAILPGLLAGLNRQGYTCVTVTELVKGG